MMRRERSSTFLVSVLIFLFIGEIQATKLQKNCSTSCGDINNISYPFRLKGDPAICGDPNFQLSCQSNKTILEFPSARRYYVKEISYKENIVRVVDVNLGTGTCRLPSGSLSEEDKRNLPSSQLISDYFGELEYNMGLQFDGYYNYATFSRCSQRINDTRFTAIPCLSENQSYFYVTIDMRYQYPFCSSEAVTPILWWSESEMMSNKTVPYETISERLQSGFNLTWSFECRDCVRHGGYCHVTAGKTLYSFYCRNSGFKTRLYNIIQYLWGIIHAVPCGGDSFGPCIPDFIHMYINLGYLTEALVPVVVLVVLICRFIGAPIVLIVYLICKYRKTRQTVDNVEKFLHNQQSWMPKRYAYAELMAVTNNFKEKLGQGGFGSVYRGQLHNGSLIAVKMLENSKFSAEEFINEVSTIGRIHHVNIVQLVGFCSEGYKRALVYEYMPNGSLDKHIFSRPDKSLSFSWDKLCEIALAIARGIEYLHGGCDVCILHFDIKPHNILLDQNFIPKVSDFGLAKFYPKENDFVY